MTKEQIDAFLAFLRLNQQERTPNTYLQGITDAYLAGYEDAIRQMQTHIDQLVER